MAVQNHENLSSLTAGADLSSSKYLLATLGSADFTVELANANSDIVLGVINENAASGSAVHLQHGGIVKVIAGAAVTRGVRLMSNASGQAITHTGANPSFAVAIEDATAAGEVISALWQTMED